MPSVLTTVPQRLAVAAGHALLRLAQPSAPQAVEGFGTVAALLALASRAKIDTDATALTVTLPRAGDDLDPRLAPIALARIGLEASWEQRRLRSLMPSELPAAVALKGGKFVLLLAVDAAGVATILGGKGESRLLLADLQAAATGVVLLVGRADPVNGDAEAAERQRIRERPRQWLLGLFFTDRKRLAQMMLAAALLNLCALAIPLYMRAVYDRVVPNLAIETLWALSLGIVLVLVFEYAFKHIRLNFIDSIGLRMGQVVQHRVMWSVLRSRLDRTQHSAGSLMNALRDVEAMSVLVPSALVTFLVDIPYFFVYAALIYAVGGATVVAPVLGAAAMAGVGLLAAYGLKRAGERSSRLMQARHNLVVDINDGLGTIKANQAEGRFLRQWDLMSDHIAVTSRTVREWNENPGSIAALLVQLVTVLVVVIGVFQIKAGEMSVGGLVAATMLAGRAMVPVSNAIALVSRAYQSLTQFLGLSTLLALEPEAEAGDRSIATRRLSGDMAFAGVGFRYDGAAAPVLHDINLRIAPGERVALIGRSGSGKSTLMQMMAGLLEPSSGRLLMDGHNVAHYATAQLRNHVAYAAQDAVLFNASLRDNILLGADAPDEALLAQAVEAAGVASFAARTPEGYGFKVGARGDKLSGGQRQSIILARALVRNASLLLLDEPTESMDLVTEQAVIAGLRSYAEGRTLVLATHRPALLTLVDRVIWLDDGRIVADEPTEAVLAKLGGQGGRSRAA